LTINYSADEKPVDAILDEMFSKNQLGYVIVSDSKDRRDGFIIIKKGKQRGYEAGEEEAKDKAAVKDKKDGAKPDKDGDNEPKKDKAVKDKAAKDKAAKDKRAKDKDKGDKDDDDDKPAKDKASKDKKDKASKDKPMKDGGDEDVDKTELQASSKLKLAKMLQKDGLVKKAIVRFKDIVKDFPKTKAADEARAILKKLDE
jgi:colicin import membrane protein